MTTTRREFLRQSAIAGAAVAAPYFWTGSARGQNSPWRRYKYTAAAIGVGGSRGAYSQGTSIALKACEHARMIAVCDVDSVHAAEFNARFDDELNMYTDYRQLFDQEKPDVVTIGTPDHWHVPIAIAALRAGCDVYCEKPLTLTIEEGVLIRDAVRQTGRVFQVGTQQRSEFRLLFLQAVALIKSGRLGKNVRADIAIGGGMVGGPFESSPPPDGLNWDMWIGPANAADYSHERCKEFRWYYDYSGGKMTDWGAHHIDIAQWALGHDHSGPQRVKLVGPTRFTSLVPDHFDWHAYLAGEATLPNGYHTATEFHIELQYADGSAIAVHDRYRSEDGKTEFPNGILFTGDQGRIFVNRERLTGKPVEDLSTQEKVELYQSLIPLYKNRWAGDHMRNFFECVEDRGEPISDVETHHRTMTCCHLCNIALMLGRDLAWDPDAERFAGDDQAAAFMTRPRREAYSLAATT
jgi:predicted dehydrogenase